MLTTIKERCVARFEQRDVKGRLLLVINTALVTDSSIPYETAISSLEYNKGGWIVVECYDNPEDAAIGHIRWEDRMTQRELPDELVETSRCDAMKLVDLLLSQNWRVKPRQSPHDDVVISRLWLAQEVKTLTQRVGKHYRGLGTP